MYDVYTIIHDKMRLFIICGNYFSCADLSPAKKWLTLSESVLELLDKIENCDSKNDAEPHKFRLEQSICSSHLILPILPVDSESSQVAQQLSQNLRILLIGSYECHLDSRNCTALAV